jgi:SH3 domain-containing protein
MEREQSDTDTDSATRSADELGTHNDDSQAEPTFRPLFNTRSSRDQPAPREATVAHWWVAPSHLSAQQPAHRLPGSRLSRDQARWHEREAIAGARAQGSGGDTVRSGRNNIALLSFLFAVGMVIGLGATSAMLAPGLSRSVRSLAAAAQGNANLYVASSHDSGRFDGGGSVPVGIPHDSANSTTTEVGNNAHPDGSTSEQKLLETQQGRDDQGGNAQLDGESSERKLAEIQQRLDALEKSVNALPRALPVEPPRIVSENGVPALPVQDPKPGAAGQSDKTSPPHPVQIQKTGDKAAVLLNAEPADADGANLNATPQDSAVRSEQASHSPVQALPPPAQDAQPGLREARLRQVFEQFLNEREQTSSSPQDREKLFADFKKLVYENSLNGSSGEDAPATSGSTRPIETWQALETTNLRELASAASTVIGEVAKGSTFRVIGRSEEGKWLKIKTNEGLTGYYWAARARQMR